MAVNRSVIVTLLLIWSGSMCAQRVDTVYHENEEYPYSVLEKNADGKPHGVAQVFGRNGEVRQTVQFVNGVLQGPETRYHENGEVSLSAFYEQDKYHGTVTSYYPDGQLRSTLEYYKGLYHGMYTYYHDNGQVGMTASYKKGKIHGTSHLYYPNGNIEWTKGYRNGKLHGERIAWDSTGVLMEGQHTFKIDPLSEHTYTVICINGRPEGAFKLIHSDGRIIFTGKYVNGLPDGEWIYYERTGLVDRVDVYRKGKFKETRRTYN